MAKVVEVKKSQKDYPEFGIKKGDTHYRWMLRTGPRSSQFFRSITYPKPSQLTTSVFLKPVYTITESLEAIDNTITYNDLVTKIRNFVEEIRNLGREQEEKFDNLPPQIQNCEQGALLCRRLEFCNKWADSLEKINIHLDIESIADKVAAANNKDCGIYAKELITERVNEILQEIHDNIQYIDK